MLKKLLRMIRRAYKSKVPIEVSKSKINLLGGLRPINETLPEDVFIVGFPKSGNTLMQHIISHLNYGLNEEGSRSMVNLIVPDIYANTHYFRFNDICFFKSHERPNPHYKKVIYVMRDGREALLSYHYMMKNMGEDVSLEDLYTGQIPIYGGLWHEHIEAWQKNPYKAEILWIKYEDLILDKKTEITRICEFLNLERSLTEISDVIANTSFNHMKSLEKRNDWKKMNTELSFNKGDFVRKGKINSFTKEVPKNLILKFEKNSDNRFYNFN